MKIWLEFVTTIFQNKKSKLKMNLLFPAKSFGKMNEIICDQHKIWNKSFKLHFHWISSKSYNVTEGLGSWFYDFHYKSYAVFLNYENWASLLFCQSRLLCMTAALRCTTHHTRRLSSEDISLIHGLTHHRLNSVY